MTFLDIIDGGGICLILGEKDDDYAYDFDVDYCVSQSLLVLIPADVRPIVNLSGPAQIFVKYTSLIFVQSK